MIYFRLHHSRVVYYPELQITIPTHFYINDACENELCGAPKSQSASTKTPVCFEVDGSFYVINANDWRSINIPKEINGSLYFIDCWFEFFRDISETIKKISGDVVLVNPKITSGILGLLMIKDLEQIKVCGTQSDDFKKAIDIVNTYLEGTRNIPDCQDELIDAGLDEYADA